MADAAPLGIAGFAEIADVSRETLDRLTAYVDLLARWQPRINLVGPRTMDDIWRRHILDSWQVMAHFPPDAVIAADLGAGAGLPGLVVAAARPGMDIHLVESDARKCVFLREAARAIDGRVTVHHMRIEAAALPPMPLILARALAPLETLIGYAVPHLAAHGICLFHKGGRWAEELTAARQRWKMQADALPSLTDPDARILRIGGRPAPLTQPAD